MYIPIARERVRMLGYSGEFLVLRADYARQTADLADVDDSYTVHEGIAFQAIFAVFEQPEKPESERRPPRSERPLHGPSRTVPRTGE